MDADMQQHFLAEEIIVLCLEGEGELRGGPGAQGRLLRHAVLRSDVLSALWAYSGSRGRPRWCVLVADGGDPNSPPDD